MLIVRSFELRFHIVGTVTPVDGTVDFALTSFEGFPTFGGALVDPGQGSAASTAYVFRAKDVQGLLPPNLGSPSTGRPDLLGRLVEYRESDNGAPPTRYFVGRCSRIVEVEPGLWEIQVTDERYAERTAELFAEATDSVQLWPPGPRYRFRQFPGAIAERALARVTGSSSANRKRLALSSAWVMEPEIARYISEDVVEEASGRRDDGLGNFRHLRLELAGTGTFEVVSFGNIDRAEILEGLTDQDGRVGANMDVWVVDPGGAIGPVGTFYPGAASFIAPTAPPSKVLPLLVGVVDPTHPYGVPALADGRAGACLVRFAFLAFG